jgi:hypothetical protein
MKKSILILPSIILLFLVNACTLLPTGGSVSSNINYTVHNATLYALTNLFGPPGVETLDFDLTEDGYVDFNVGTTHSGYVYIYGGGEVSVASTFTSPYNTTILKDFVLSEPISSSNYWNSTGTQLLYHDVTGQIAFSPTPKADGTIILGIRYLKNGDYYFGWIKLYNDKINRITVIESAFNKLPNQLILAGKK